MKSLTHQRETETRNTRCINTHGKANTMSKIARYLTLRTPRARKIADALRAAIADRRDRSMAAALRKFDAEIAKHDDVVCIDLTRAQADAVRLATIAYG